MTNYFLNVKNIKCGGCANVICTTLDALDGVNNTVVNVTNGAVMVDGHNGIREKIASKLKDLGYPETNDSSNRNSFRSIARSYLSCAKGRMYNGKEYKVN